MYFLLGYFELSVSVQVIIWKDSSPEVFKFAETKTAITHSLESCFLMFIAIMLSASVSFGCSCYLAARHTWS